MNYGTRWFSSLNIGSTQKIYKNPNLCGFQRRTNFNYLSFSKCNSFQDIAIRYGLLLITNQQPRVLRSNTEIFLLYCMKWTKLRWKIIEKNTREDKPRHLDRPRRRKITAGNFVHNSSIEKRRAREGEGKARARARGSLIIYLNTYTTCIYTQARCVCTRGQIAHFRDRPRTRVVQ